MNKNLPNFFQKYLSPNRHGPVTPIGSKTRGTRKVGKKWQAWRCVDGRRIHVGMFDTQEEAFAASQKARGLTEGKP